MKQILKFTLVNTIIFVIIILILEAGIWFFENNQLVLSKDEYVLKNGFFPFHKGITNFTFDEKIFRDNPIGAEYKNKKPIVIFGCSYAYGFLLNREQTLSYKLSNLTHRTIYNRAYPAWGSAHMLYQTRDENLYKEIPEPEYVIFLSMHDHFRRLYVMTFMSGDILSENFYLRYKERNGELIQIQNKNKFLNLIKRLYLVQKIHHYYVNNILLKNEDYTKAYDFYARQVIESKNNMQKHWKNTKFIYIQYDWIKDREILFDKLEEAGYTIIYLPELTNEDIFSKKYILSKDYHPNENAWNLLTPLIAKELKL